MKESSERSFGYTVLAVGIAGAALAFYSKRRKSFRFNGKVALVTGGSRGLGLILARRLVREGARVAIAARDPDELARAGRELRDRGGNVIEIVCDVRRREECTAAVERCVEHFGGLDVLINNAGIIQAGPLESQTEKDFRDAMDTHFWGPYYMVEASLEHLKRSDGARIINIASIGGKVAVPHLAPYCASKFALVGLSSAWRSELAKEGITVTTVCPGLMRTGSHVNAEFKGQQEKEYALFSIMDALPFTSVNADSAARQILRASRNGNAELVISVQAKTAAAVNAAFPEMLAAAMSAVNYLLPAGNATTDKQKGIDSTSIFSPSLLTANIDEQAKLNNELAPGEVI